MPFGISRGDQDKAGTYAVALGLVKRKGRVNPIALLLWQNELGVGI